MPISGIGRIHDAMFVVIFAIEKAPMQTRMIDTIDIDALQDINLSIVWLAEGLWRQQLECRPYSGCAGYETNALSAQCLMACETSAGKGAIVRNGADDKVAVAVGEGLRGFGGVVLKLVIAPAMCAELVLELLRDRDSR